MPSHRCDLCLATDSIIVSPANPPIQGRIALCRRCGLFFTSPQLMPEELEQFYADEFTGDAGAQQLSREEGRPSPKKVKSETRRTERWSFPLVHRYLDPAGKTILDLRSRSGALAEKLTASGAQVIASDPFPANIQYAKQQRRIPRLQVLPITEMHVLPGIAEDSMDVITALTVHVLAHLLSPRKFLQRAFQVLKPGGKLFLMEKDVLFPHYNVARPTPFASGIAHQFHLTRDTLFLYLKAAGFEVIRCDIDPRHATGQNRVITAVACKPMPAETSSPADLFRKEHDVDGSLRRIQHIQTHWQWYALKGKLRQRWWKLQYKYLSGPYR